MYQIAIVEDEEIYAKMLEEFIHRYERDSSHQFKIRHYRDGSEIADNYRGGFDIILMDIQMKFMDGMTAAEMIRKRDPEVLIIFITNRSDYAVRGYEVDALDYVVKPVEYFAFSQKLDRAVARRGRSRDYHLMVHADGGLYKLSASQILFVESERHNVHFYTTTGKLTSRMNMGKGYIINLDKIDSFSDGICRIGSYNVPVSRSKKKEFMNVLTDYMGSTLL